MKEHFRFRKRAGELSKRRLGGQNFGLWHFPLNCGGIFNSEKECNSFQEELRRSGFPRPVNGDDLDRILADSVLGPRKRANWDKIFQLDWYHKDWCRSPADKQLQSVLWEIPPTEVCSVDSFNGR